MFGWSETKKHSCCCFLHFYPALYWMNLSVPILKAIPYLLIWFHADLWLFFAKKLFCDAVSSRVLLKFMVSAVPMTSFPAVNLKCSTRAPREPWQLQQLLYKMNVFSLRVSWAGAHWRLITPCDPTGGIQKYKYPCDAMASARCCLWKCFPWEAFTGYCLS